MTAAATPTLDHTGIVHDDLALIRAAQDGDRYAFSELVRRHWDGVVRVVYRMCGDPDLAEESAQEAFIRAWQRLSGYDSKYAFRGWIYRIGINAALDTLRREKPTGDLEMMDERGLLVDSSAGPEAAAESRERAGRVQQAILALPEASRAALVLREYGGLTYAEIAAAQNVPLGTVMSRLNAARSQLRKTLAEWMEVL